MTKVEQLHRDPTPALRTLRPVLETEQDVYWCHMHATPRAGEANRRPCFSPALIADIATFQAWTAQRIAQRALEADEEPVAHVVLASDEQVFNLGGDLGVQKVQEK